MRSQGMDHCWNLIKIYGNWHHVDMTWDDPITNVEGRVLHDYFLKTDKEISSGKNGHFGWVTSIKCTDKTYSDSFWNGITRHICKNCGHSY